MQVAQRFKSRRLSATVTTDATWYIVLFKNVFHIYYRHDIPFLQDHRDLCANFDSEYPLLPELLNSDSYAESSRHPEGSPHHIYFSKYCFSPLIQIYCRSWRFVPKPMVAIIALCEATTFATTRSTFLHMKRFLDFENDRFVVTTILRIWSKGLSWNSSRRLVVPLWHFARLSRCFSGR